MKAKPIPILPPNPFYEFNSKLKQSERILENHKIITWDSHFLYSSIPTKDLDSLFLNSNPFFKELLSLIEAYNLEVDLYKTQGTPIMKGPFRSHFFMKLHQILLEVFFTKDRVLQEYFIETVHSWALDQLSQDLDPGKKPNEGLQRPLTGLTGSTKGDIVHSRPQSSVKKPFTGINKHLSGANRPFSAVNRPFSGVLTKEKPIQRPFSGILSGEKPQEGVYQYIKPLSDWKRPLSSITRPWSGTSYDILEETKGEEPIGEITPPQEAEGIYEVVEESEEEEEPLNGVFNEENLLPSQYIKNVLKDYDTGARTKIDYEDAPYERLKSYKRKVILKGNQLDNNKTNNKEPLLKKASEEKPDVILYEKPLFFLQEQQKLMELKEEEKAKAEAIKALKQKESPEEEPIPLTTTKGSPKKRRRKNKKEYPFKASLIPEHKPFTNDELFSEPRGSSAQNHLKKKFEIKSTFLQYQPSEDLREMNMELKWFYNRNKELNDKRVDEEMVTMMKEWASNKERIETEINRKIQSEYQASQFQKLEYTLKTKENEIILNNEDLSNDEEDSPVIDRKTRPFSSILPRTHDFRLVEPLPVRKDIILYDIKGIEEVKAQKKLENVRMYLGEVINALPNKEEEDKGKIPKSLSVYSRGLSLNKGKPRPFSAFIESQKPMGFRNEQLFEINEIKEKMASYRLKTNSKALVNALLVPEGLNDLSKLRSLPVPGSDLIKNPFNEVKKKRRKGKKGKKGKGKAKKT